MSRDDKRVLIIGALIALLIVFAFPAFGHDHSNPGNNDWMKSLHSTGKTWCCNGDDTDAIEDWDTAGPGGSYRVRFRGAWFNVPENAIVDGPNKAGDALLWMNKGWGGLSVRCFMPGSLT